MGARYYVIPPYQKLPQHIKALVKLFKENRYAIVHSGMNTLAPISLFCAKIAAVPVRINHNHSTAGRGETKKNILKYCLRPFAKCFATHYAACSYFSGEWLYGKKMMESGKVAVFNNAIDPEKYAYNEAVRKEVRQEFAIEDRYVVGHVGRFEYQKNHDFLIDVFKEVHDRDNSAILMLVGIGNLMDMIRNKVGQLGLSDSVLFLGVRKDVNRLYQAMDVFVLPSRYEGLPVVGVEAQAAGIPCIFSDQMTSETVITQETEVLCLEAGVSVWSEAILKYKGSKKRVTKEDIRKAGFDIKTEAHKLEDYYSDALQADPETRK